MTDIHPKHEKELPKVENVKNESSGAHVVKASRGIMAYIFGDTATGLLQDSIDEEERGWISSFKNIFIRISRFLGLERWLSWLPMISFSPRSGGGNKNEEHSNKRKHNQLENDEDTEGLQQVEKEAKKWRPDSAYVSIQLFIRKMFGAPDPNGNLDREDNSDNLTEESQQISEEPGRNWNMKPDCHFIEGEEEDAAPFSSPDKGSCDENLNEFETEAVNVSI